MFPPTQLQREKAAREKVRCILAYAHVLLREGLSRLLQDESDLEVVAEAGDITETVQRVAEHQPQVVIADARALGLSAAELERRIREVSPATKIVFLNLNDEQFFRQAATAAVGSEPPGGKQTSAEQLVQMVRSAAAEGNTSWFGPAICEMPRLGRSSAQTLAPRKHLLTTREREVLKLLAEGRTVRSAALVLGVSAKTVDAHKFNLMRKLGLHNKVDLVMSAIQMGVLKVPVNF